MIKKILIKIYNRVSNLQSLLLTLLYKNLFGQVGSVRIWGSIKVLYPQNISIGDGCSINHGVYLNAYNSILFLQTQCLLLQVLIFSHGYVEK